MRPRAGIRDKIRPAHPLPHSTREKTRPARHIQRSCREKTRPTPPLQPRFREKVRPARHKPPILGHFSRAGRTFSRSHPRSDRAGRTFSRTGHRHVATVKPPSPLQPKNAPKTPISHPQRRREFQTDMPNNISTPGPTGVEGAGGIGGLVAVPVGGGRARAGLVIDHSEPQARVWRSRGRAAAHRHTQRPGPTSNARTPERHSKRGRHQPTPCASALTHP